MGTILHFYLKSPKILVVPRD